MKELTQTASAKDYLVTFGSQTGARVLKELKAAYYDRPSYEKGDPYETAKREGERAVVLRILSKFKAAKSGKEEKEIIQSVLDDE